MSMRGRGELKYLKCSVQMAKRASKSLWDEYLYSPPKILAVGERISNSASLAVRPQYNWRSDRQKGPTTILALTAKLFKNRGDLAVRPQVNWRSDRQPPPENFSLDC